MAKRSSTAAASNSPASPAAPSKPRQAALKTVRMLELERELVAEKVTAKALARMADGTKLAKWLAGLTDTAKARVTSIMYPPTAPEGERPTDAAYATPESEE